MSDPTRKQAGARRARVREVLDAVEEYTAENIALALVEVATAEAQNGMMPTADTLDACARVCGLAGLVVGELR